jgi:hypothetical protein
MYEYTRVNGTEFIRRAKRYAKKNRLTIRFDATHGKGSHGRLLIGGKMTTIKRTEISKSLLSAMLKDLGIDKGEF